jgi:hypothetical protein
MRKKDTHFRYVYTVHKRYSCNDPGGDESFSLIITLPKFSTWDAEAKAKKLVTADAVTSTYKFKFTLREVEEVNGT